MTDPILSDAFRTAADIEVDCGITAGVVRLLRVEWTAEWPTEPGFYWFYGIVYKPDPDSVPILDLARVQMLPGGLAAITGHGILWRNYVGPHRWAKAQLPEPPEIEEIKGES